MPAQTEIPTTNVELQKALDDLSDLLAALQSVVQRLKLAARDTTKRD